MEEFVACFAEVVAPRQDDARHDLHELLLIALCAMPAGGKDGSAMALFGKRKEPFLRRFLRLRHGVPSHDTLGRAFQAKPLGLRRAARPGAVRGLLHATFRQGLAGRGGDQRQDAAALLGPSCRQVAAARGSCLVSGPAATAGSACG